MSKKTDAIETANLDASTMVYAIANQQEKETASDEKEKEGASALQKRDMATQQHMAELNAIKNLTKAGVAKNDVNSAHSSEEGEPTDKETKTITTNVDDLQTYLGWLNKSGWGEMTDTPKHDNPPEDLLKSGWGNKNSWIINAKNDVNSAHSSEEGEPTGKEVNAITPTLDHPQTSGYDLNGPDEDVSVAGYRDKSTGEWVTGDNPLDDLSASGYKHNNSVWTTGNKYYNKYYI